MCLCVCVYMCVHACVCVCVCALFFQCQTYQLVKRTFLWSLLQHSTETTPIPNSSCPHPVHHPLPLSVHSLPSLNLLCHHQHHAVWLDLLDCLPLWYWRKDFGGFLQQTLPGSLVFPLTHFLAAFPFLPFSQSLFQCLSPVCHW